MPFPIRSPHRTVSGIVLVARLPMDIEEGRKP
jgi:hypothetical protein